MPVRELYALCGGLPAFLKVVYEALASGELEVSQPPEAWRKQIVARPDFQRFAQEIWDNYQSNEQAAMRGLALRPQNHVMPPEVEKYLLQMGILRESYNGDTVEFFSRLFADFVGHQASDEKGITIHGAEVYRDGLRVALAKQEFMLFKYLNEREGTVCAKLDLIKHIWSDDEEYDEMYDESDERLPALVRRLRARIDKDPSHQYIENIRGRGYKFVQFLQA